MQVSSAGHALDRRDHRLTGDDALDAAVPAIDVVGDVRPPRITVMRPTTWKT
jgi:hypothetical protein